MSYCGTCPPTADVDIYLKRIAAKTHVYKPKLIALTN